MNTPDPVPVSEISPVVTSGPPGTAPRGRPNPLIPLGLATLAALATWFAAEREAFTFRPGVASYSMMGTPVVAETAATRASASARTAALTYGALGVALGLALGLSGSLSVGRPRSARLAGAAGVVGGIVAGGLVLGFLPAHERWLADSLGELPRSLILHAGLWGPVAMAAALAFSLGRERVDGTGRVVLGGLGGVLVFIVLFELLGAVALPLSETSDPLPGTGTARLIALVGVALATASGVALATREARQPQRGEVAGTR